MLKSQNNLYYLDILERVCVQELRKKKKKLVRGECLQLALLYTKLKGIGNMSTKLINRENSGDRFKLSKSNPYP